MPEEAPGAGAGVAGLAAQIIGLGRDVEALRRLIARQDTAVRTIRGWLADLETQVGASATTLATLTEQVTELAGGGQEAGAHRSWFATTDPEQARSRLVELAEWIEGVYLRFPDAALPACWLWHPSVVEELLWLRRSWTEAFTGSTAAIFRVADWHDRQRPGVVARIRALNDGVCSLDQHAPGAEQDRPPQRTPAVDAIPGIVDWWAARREESPPHPDETVHAGDVVDGR